MWCRVLVAVVLAGVLVGAGSPSAPVSAQGPSLTCAVPFPSGGRAGAASNHDCWLPESGGQVLKSLGRIARSHKRRIERAGFLVLKSPDIPSILIETGFLTNPSDAKRLSDKKHQDKVAQAILAGIIRYFDSNPPRGTTFAAARRHTIARGETLSEIAVRYRVSVERLRAANRIDGSIIRAGDVLRIPARSDG